MSEHILQERKPRQFRAERTGNGERKGSSRNLPLSGGEVSGAPAEPPFTAEEIWELYDRAIVREWKLQRDWTAITAACGLPRSASRSEVIAKVREFRGRVA